MKLLVHYLNYDKSTVNYDLALKFIVILLRILTCGLFVLSNFEFG